MRGERERKKMKERKEKYRVAKIEMFNMTEAILMIAFLVQKPILRIWADIQVFGEILRMEYGFFCALYSWRCLEYFKYFK